MVDIDKKKGSKGSSSSSSSSSSSKKKRSGGSSSGGVPDTHEPNLDEARNFDGASVSEVSKEWAEEGDNLNYRAQGGESEKRYVKRQVKECREFYESYVDIATDNMENIEKFTLVHHALVLSCAENRIGISKVLMDNYGYGREKAVEQAEKILSKSGEAEAFRKICTEIMWKMIEED